MKYRVLKPIRDKFGRKLPVNSVVKSSNIIQNYKQRLISTGRIVAIDEIQLQPFEGEINPCIVTGMWKRPEVFEIFGKHYQNSGIDVIVAGSEGEQSKKLAESFGFTYLEQPNSPLGRKMNSTIVNGLKSGYTHFICVGSDDLLSFELLEYYKSLMQSGYDFIGLRDFYFYDIETKKAAYWGGYQEYERKDNSVGAGRVLSRRLIESWGGTVWDNHRTKYLDKSMQSRLVFSPYPERVFRLKEKGFLAVDIKSAVNITPFKLWNNCSYIDAQILENEFSI